MMMLSSTSCRKVWLTHDTRMTGLCDAIAAGSETSARAAKAYAHHTVPTAVVTLIASQVLNRVIGLLPLGIMSWTLTGGSCFRRSIRGWRTGVKIFDMRQAWQKADYGETRGLGMYRMDTTRSASRSNSSIPARWTDLRYSSRSVCGRPSK